MTSDSGLAVIRAALLVRAKKGHLANLARDLSVGLATLEEFAHGRARLTNDILNALAVDIVGANTSYDATLDKSDDPRPSRRQWASLRRHTLKTNQ